MNSSFLTRSSVSLSRLLSSGENDAKQGGSPAPRLAFDVRFWRRRNIQSV